MDAFGQLPRPPVLKKGYIIGIVVIIAVAIAVFSLKGTISGFAAKEKAPECSDGIDNDNDGLTDYGYDKAAGKITGDTDCVSLKDSSETKDCPGAAEECNGIDDDCDGFIDDGACPFCGNSVADAGEECDGIDLNGKKCTDLEFDAGELKCRNCMYDTSGCSQIVCGNSIIDSGEECDGSNWGAIKECTDFEFTGGKLKCVSCKFDKSGCTSTKEDFCSDYDDEREYDAFGWVWGVFNSYEYNLTDKCLSETKLKEYYCEGDERRSAYYDCPSLGNNESAYACEDGRCVLK